MSEVPLYSCRAIEDGPASKLSPHTERHLYHYMYRDTSLIRNRSPLGTYSRPMPRVLWWFQKGVVFLLAPLGSPRRGSV